MQSGDFDGRLFGRRRCCIMMLKICIQKKDISNVAVRRLRRPRSHLDVLRVRRLPAVLRFGLVRRGWRIALAGTAVHRRDQPAKPTDRDCGQRPPLFYAPR
jgi:hypothetical protein